MYPHLVDTARKDSAYCYSNSFTGFFILALIVMFTENNESLFQKKFKIIAVSVASTSKRFKYYCAENMQKKKYILI